MHRRRTRKDRLDTEKRTARQNGASFAIFGFLAKISGLLQACENLLVHSISNLVCIGGDGSLTGGNQFCEDWPELLKELVDAGRVSAEKRSVCANVNIIGLVGSIDNDLCRTDMTIGTDSALHRIIEAVDAVVSTAHSHQRTFVVEVSTTALCIS